MHAMIMQATMITTSTEASDIDAFFPPDSIILSSGLVEMPEVGSVVGKYVGGGVCRFITLMEVIIGSKPTLVSALTRGLMEQFDVAALSAMLKGELPPPICAFLTRSFNRARASCFESTLSSATDTSI